MRRIDYTKMMGCLSRYAWLSAVLAYFGAEVVSLLFGAHMLPNSLVLNAIRVAWTVQCYWLGAIIEQQLAFRGRGNRNPALPPPEMFFRGMLYVVPPTLAWIGVRAAWFVPVSLLAFACLVARAVVLARRIIH
jgi:hypothetical protein